MFRNPNRRASLLAIVVLAFAVSSYVAFQRHSNTSNLLTVTLKTGAWASSELEQETNTFIHSLTLYLLDVITAEQLALKMELLWSRLNVLKEGQETKDIRELAGTTELLTDIEQTLIKYETVIYTADQQNRSMLNQALSDFKALAPKVRDFNVRSFNGPQRQAEIKSAHRQQQEFGYFLIGLLVSGALLICFIIVENVRNRRLALHDELTGLPNRKYFNEYLAKLEGQGLKGKVRFAIYLIDLDKFKNINDSYGHHDGDLYLKTIADRLRTSTTANDVVARLGGDEFVIIHHDPYGEAECQVSLKRYYENLKQPIQLSSAQVTPAATIGISFYPEDGTSISRVLANADLAMYCAKQDLSKSFAFYSREMNDLYRRRRQLSRDLREAIENNQLQLYYQPIIDLKSHQIIGCEALVRWFHPELSYITPPEVVLVAEQYGLACEFNDWIIQTACRTLKQWEQYGNDTLTINVNITPSMYTQHDLVTSISHALSITQIAAERLVVEITEDTSMQDIACSPDTMKRLKALGVGLALDDFGTGYSSLSLLRQMPIDKLKIDKCFVDDLLDHHKDIRFIRSIIRLAHSLNMQVVAEGIETLHQAQELSEEGCDFVQGYHYYCPLPEDEILSIVAAGTLHCRTPISNIEPASKTHTMD